MTVPEAKPSVVTHEGSEILIDGPDGVASSLTPEAALVTAARLEAEAVDALIERGHTVPPRDG